MDSADDQLPKDGPQPDTKLAAGLWLADHDWKEAWIARKTDIPDTLYPYTDAAGLLGIVNSSELWASHSSFVNDTGEIRYVDGLLASVIGDLAESFEGESVDRYLATVPELFNKVVVEKFEFYLACFCKDGDQLSQWRGYPSTGGGYAIGFDSTLLGMERLIDQVIYDPAEQVRLLDDVLRPACALLQAADKEADLDPTYVRDAVQMAAFAATGSIAECGLTFKHPGFAEENEYRLLRASANDKERPAHQVVIPELRASATGLLPYTPIKFSSSAGTGPPTISEVVVGPNRHPAQASLAVRHLLTANGYAIADVTIRQSATPLRV